jgi:hypothetical protein
MAKKQAHYRLDASLVEALEQRARTENITITDLVTRYLKQGLGLPVENQGSVNVEALEQKILERVSTQLQEATQADSEIEKRIAERVIEALSKNIEAKINTAIENRVTANIHNRVSTAHNKAQEISGRSSSEGKAGDSQPTNPQNEIVEESEPSHKDSTGVKKSSSQLLKILEKEQPKGNWSLQKLRLYTLEGKGNEEHTIGQCRFKYAGKRERTKEDRSGSWFDVVYPLKGQQKVNSRPKR